jgi:hypothetical protein
MPERRPGGFLDVPEAQVLCSTVRMKRETRHVPVLLAHVLDVLSPKPGQVVVDCTPA